jgi:hypothetical protein
MQKSEKIVYATVFIVFIVVCLTKTIYDFNKPSNPDTQEVCTRSHIKQIPVIGINGEKTYVPAERCDEYKIEKAQ